MIVTLTPNPSIDRAIVIDALLRGEVHRASQRGTDGGCRISLTGFNLQG